MSVFRREVHLVCNAHLDPTWLWPWEEGAAEAVSTFRTAADCCDEFPDFIFTHNEALLYQWVEEYDPELFRRIQRLVRRGRWHISGGWFLQPDCNMPSGEALVRQILVGRRYFKRKFGVSNQAACNFDSFGHSRGLVQILARSGYTGYVHGRPEPEQAEPPLPGRSFRWGGFDGSAVLAHNPPQSYLSLRGDAAAKVERVLAAQPKDSRAPVLVLWGIGNHGGGPSREDLLKLEALRRTRRDVRIMHSTPERFFRSLRNATLPAFAASVRHVAIGCYTSQVRMKQTYRELESLYFATEAIAAEVWARGLAARYPEKELGEALRDLLFAQFHDILPGSSIRLVEEGSLQSLRHGLEILRRLRTRSLFAIGRTLPPAADGETPLLAANSHPWPLEGVFSCELNLADQHWPPESFFEPLLTLNGRRLPAQCEKPDSNINLEWRKKLVFRATLPPSQVSRISVRFRPAPQPPPPAPRMRRGCIVVKGRHMEIEVSGRSGLVRSLAWKGIPIVRPDALGILEFKDDHNPWGGVTWPIPIRRFDRPDRRFRLATLPEARAIRGRDSGSLPSVALVEDGRVRSVIEAIFRCGHSQAVVQYRIPKEEDFLDVHVRLLNQQPAVMLKMSIPISFDAARVLVQTVCGREPCPLNGREQVMQQWCAAVPARDSGAALAILTQGTYAFSATKRDVRMNLLRSPLYSYLPIGGREMPGRLLAQPYIDVGEREFGFRLIPGSARALLDRVDRAAQAYNQPPLLVPFFPGGTSGAPRHPFVSLSDDSVLLTAAKKSEDGDSLIVRLFEPTGSKRRTKLTILGKWSCRVDLGAFEIKTLRVNLGTGAVTSANLLA